MESKKDFWDNIDVSYPLYPTVRHRLRFILSMMRKFSKPGNRSFIFDYGCGTGDMIFAVKNTYELSDNQLGGSDMSEKSIQFCRGKFDSPYFYQKMYPVLEKKCDVIICSEVIEHAVNYKEILHWVSENLRAGGVFLLSTQGGKMHKIDEYSGHVHTFKIEDLKMILASLGFEISYSRRWGFPLFTWQKMMTDFNFNKIKDSYLEGELSVSKKMFFNFVYLIYFIEDLIDLGPQLYICAKKK